MFQSPRREWAIIALNAIALGMHYLLPATEPVLVAVAALGAVPVVMRAVRDLLHRKLTIDVFNILALGVSFGTGEFPSAAFIVLMITSADFLEWRTRMRTEDAVTSLLRLKPQTALRKEGEDLKTVSVSVLKADDIIVAESGQAIAADGVVVSGTATVNEALVTGESAPVQKSPGSHVLGSTIVDSGALKVRVTRVGKESTLERMADLMREAAKNKSRPERLADRFAVIFLPIVLVIAAGVYWQTRSANMVAALFLVACADDMALAIPLAMTAALGWAARNGVVVKGGTWLDTLSKVRTVVLDKTGTLTYGAFRLEHLHIEPHVPEHTFWRLVGIAEKFSEHPLGRALWNQARMHATDIPDPDEVKIIKGAGIWVRGAGHQIAIGTEELFQQLRVPLSPRMHELLDEARARSLGSVVLVAVDGNPAGTISLADVPRQQAAGALERLRRLGVRDLIMFTGDREAPAQRVGAQLGITDVRAQMTPEAKLQQLEQLRNRPVAMIGDGINDAPALARADIGIAMGRGGTAIASEAADAIVLNDDLRRVADLVLLGRRTLSVIHWDIAIWAFSNAVGFALVLTGVAGPSLAAFYNFATDFLPLINSTRLVRRRAW